MSSMHSKSKLEQFLENKLTTTVLGRVDKIHSFEEGYSILLRRNMVYINQSMIQADATNNKQYVIEEKEAMITNVTECSGLIVYLDQIRELKHGDWILVAGDILPLTPATNPGQFDQYSHYKSKRIHAKMYGTQYEAIAAKQEVLHEIADEKQNKHIVKWSNTISNICYHIKEMLYQGKEKLKNQYIRLLPEKEAGVLHAMLLGDDAMLKEDVKELYQENGISHIIAISGLHMSFFGLTLLKLLRKLRCPLLLATILTILMILFYGILTNNSVSAKRAIGMMILSLIATLLGKTYDSLSALSFSALLVLFEAPMQLYQAGFLLSYGAVLGITLIYPVLRVKVQGKGKLCTTILESILVSFSVQIITLPVLFYFFFEYASYSIILNLLILPLLSILFPMAVLAGIFSLFFYPIAVLCIGIVYFILKSYEFLCRSMELLPANLLLLGKPEYIQVIMYYIIVTGAVLMLILRKGKKILFLCLTLLCLLFALFSIKPGKLQLAYLDVGQGDCNVVRNHSGNTYLIDAGSGNVSKVGQKRVIPYLKSQGIWKLKCVFLSHADFDHISGVIEIMEQMKDVTDHRRAKAGYQGDIHIESLCLPYIARQQENYQSIVELAKQKGILIYYAKDGTTLTDGQLHFSCLSPSINEEGLDENQQSMVLALTYDGFRALFLGDIDRKVEMNLLARNEEIAKESFHLLKVAHHGSKSSSDSEFIHKIKPLYSIISSSKNNRYGHPHEETIASLQSAHSKVVKTCETGAVLVSSNGKWMQMKYFMNE